MDLELKLSKRLIDRKACTQESTDTILPGRTILGRRKFALTRKKGLYLDVKTMQAQIAHAK